jgi:hypothetical protein
MDFWLQWSKPTLKDQIKESQKGHESIEGIKCQMDKEEVVGFSIDAEGVLWYNGRLCVPNIPDLKQLIMEEAHNTPYSIHPRGTKMYQDLKETFWWHGMKRGIPCLLLGVMFVSESKQSINAQLVYFNPCNFPYGNGMKWEWTLLLDFQDRIVVMILFGLSLTVLPRMPISCRSKPLAMEGS